MTVTPVIPVMPAASPLERGIAGAERALALMREAAKRAPDGAVTASFTLHATSEREVNEVAAEWNIRPWWTMNGRLYVAVREEDGARMEVAYGHVDPADTEKAA
jgi:hypothetical protein